MIVYEGLHYCNNIGEISGKKGLGEAGGELSELVGNYTIK